MRPIDIYCYALGAKIVLQKDIEGALERHLNKIEGAI